MISLILPLTHDEPALLYTLSACVAGVAEGVIRDAVLVTPELSEAMERMSDAAGCKVVVAEGPRNALISAAGQVARSDWWLVVTPGMIPNGPWLSDLNAHLATAEPTDIGLTRMAGRGSLWRVAEAGLLPVFGRLTGNLDPRLGLLIHRSMWGDNHRHKPNHQWVTLPTQWHDRRKAVR